MNKKNQMPLFLNYCMSSIIMIFKITHILFGFEEFLIYCVCFSGMYLQWTASSPALKAQ
jgi:hypothetical protein